MTETAVADLLALASEPGGVWLTLPTCDHKALRLEIVTACNLAGHPVNITTAANTIHVQTRSAS